MNNYTVGFIGGGNMARSLIGGLVPETIDASRLLVGEPDADKCASIHDDFGVRCTADNEQIIRQSDVIVIAVKPQVVGAVLTPLKDVFSEKQPLIVSIVAGIRIDTFNRLLGQEHAVIRVMPNTPALVGRGASGLYAGPDISADQRAAAETLMGAVGTAAWVESEADIDTVTALSGSGPAYFMLFMKALSEAAESAGLDGEIARELTVATAAGAAELVDQSPESLEELIRRVTSPGGTTEQALQSFNNNALSQIVAQAVEAARQRSEELARELDTGDTGSA